MSAKRTAINRVRKGLTDPAMVKRFLALDAVPPSRRKSAKFEREVEALHEQLGLRWEHAFMSASVFDPVFDPCGQKPHERTYDERLRCFQVRQQLLAAA